MRRKSNAKLFPGSKSDATKYRDRECVMLFDGSSAESLDDPLEPWIIPEQEWVLIPLEPPEEPRETLSTPHP